MKDVEIITRVVGGKFTPPSELNPDVPPALDAIVLKGLSPNPKTRFESARAMALELAGAVDAHPREEVAATVERFAARVLEGRSEKIRAMELAAVELAPDEDAGEVTLGLPDFASANAAPPTTLSPSTDATADDDHTLKNATPPHIDAASVPLPGIEDDGPPSADVAADALQGGASRESQTLRAHASTASTPGTGRARLDARWLIALAIAAFVAVACALVLGFRALQ
jgi:serine/threonine-protein kinase